MVFLYQYKYNIVSFFSFRLLGSPCCCSHSQFVWSSKCYGTRPGQWGEVDCLSQRGCGINSCFAGCLQSQGWCWIYIHATFTGKLHIFFHIFLQVKAFCFIFVYLCKGINLSSVTNVVFCCRLYIYSVT